MSRYSFLFVLLLVFTTGRASAQTPPVAVLTDPTNGSVFTASASVALSADAASQYNEISNVDFYANNVLVGSVSNAPYTLTTIGLAQGSYTLQAVALDTAGLAGTSDPVNITVTAGSGLAYGLTARSASVPFLNMPSTIDGFLPPLLSDTGAFADTPNMQPANGLIPYDVTVPLWSDGAVKTRWMVVPNNGAPYTPDEQIDFAPTGEWSFPTGTIFVKHFDLVTDHSDLSAPKRRLETRLLVRDTNGAVYGVTYKWRPDNSDADLLSTSLMEDIVITNADHTTWTQSWYYPSPADCLTCHTPAANYVLGVKTRQLDSSFTYPSTGQIDNQLRSLNRVGLFRPSIDESNIAGYSHLEVVTNATASLEDRARSYLDANCAQCHRPGGIGPSFDARWDTPLANQNLIYGVLAKGNLGYDSAYIVMPKDIWRSILYQRANSIDPAVKMPTLARNLVDTNSLSVIAVWINSLPGVPALEPPAINPPGGIFTGSVLVTLYHPDTNAAIFYTLDDTLPSTDSFPYSGPFLLSNTATVSANAFENGFANSVATRSSFTIAPGPSFTSAGFLTNGTFQVQLSGTVGKTYVFQGSSDFVSWVPVSTNVPVTSPFSLVDLEATNFQYRFYRAIEQ
jgi:uncharacterized repeat protein (TIGR03806 family)